MKTKYYLLFLALLLSFCFHNEVMAQKCLVFGYDSDGNRISRIESFNCYGLRDMENVQDTFEFDEIEVYPNPTYESFKVFMPDGIKRETACYELFDISGVMLLKDNLGGCETEVNIRGLSAGVYVLKIINGDDVMSKMILKY